MNGSLNTDLHAENGPFFSVKRVLFACSGVRTNSHGEEGLTMKTVGKSKSHANTGDASAAYSSVLKWVLDV